MLIANVCISFLFQANKQDTGSEAIIEAWQENGVKTESGYKGNTSLQLQQYFYKRMIFGCKKRRTLTLQVVKHTDRGLWRLTEL